MTEIHLPSVGGQPRKVFPTFFLHFFAVWAGFGGVCGVGWCYRVEGVLMFRDDFANEVLGSEAFLWLMCGGAHVESHVDVLRPLWNEWRLAGGLAWGEAPPAVEVDPAGPLNGFASGGYASGGVLCGCFLRGRTAEQLAGPLASDGGVVRGERWRG